MNVWRILIGLLILVCVWGLLFWASKNLCPRLTEGSATMCRGACFVLGLLAFIAYGLIEYMFAYEAGGGYTLSNGTVAPPGHNSMYAGASGQAAREARYANNPSYNDNNW